MTKISKINAREILDSRGNPTIEVEVFLGNHYGRALVPSGASIGSREVIELRDQDQKRFFGKGVLQAVDNVKNKISEILIGLEVTQQEKIDQLMIELDGTKNKSNLGANAILGTSLAVAKAAASSLNLPLYEYLAKDNKGQIPTPMVNIINGGLHANNNLDIQEFMIIPKKETSFREMIRSSAEVFHSLKKILTDNGHSTNVGDEGGFAPNLSSIEVALDYIMQAIDRAGYSENFSIALDSAASTFYQDGNYLIAEKKLNYEELTEYYSQLCTQYPIISLEDPLAEDDFIGWKHITNVLGDKVQLVGDDLFVTNPEIFLQGIENNLANAILIKPNQIGTLTETLRTIEIARKYNYKSIISHRSGETEDTTIAHIGVGVCLEYIKTGSLSRSERVAKYNELLRIEENL